MSIDLGFAAWLKADELKLEQPSPAAGLWSAQGVEASSSSPFATAAGAQAEADRRAAFFSAPIVRDTAIVTGERSDLIGRCIDLVGTDLDYGDGPKRVLVMGVAEQDNGTTVLTVLRRLA